MLTHAQIWNAIDALARRQGLTPSALAKSAGLDATTFNKSKRQSSEGHPRWPSTESIAKILAATQVSIDDFLALIGAENSVLSLPFRLMDEMSSAHFSADGRASGAGWDQIDAPGSRNADSFAIGVTGNGFAPVYHDGAVLIASASAPRRKGDRILMIERDGRLTLGELGHETARQVQIRAFSSEVGTGSREEPKVRDSETARGQKDRASSRSDSNENRSGGLDGAEIATKKMSDIRLIARILWVSQ